MVLSTVVVLLLVRLSIRCNMGKLEQFSIGNLTIDGALSFGGLGGKLESGVSICTTPPAGWSVENSPDSDSMSWIFDCDSIGEPFSNTIVGTKDNQYGMLFKDAAIDKSKDVTISFELTIDEYGSMSSSEYFIPFALYPTINPDNWMFAQGIMFRMHNSTSTKYGISIYYYDKNESDFIGLRFSTGAWNVSSSSYYDIDKDKPVTVIFESDAASQQWRVTFDRWWNGTLLNTVVSDWVNWSDTGTGSDDHYINMGKMTYRYCQWHTDGISYAETE